MARAGARLAGIHTPPGINHLGVRSFIPDLAKVHHRGIIQFHIDRCSDILRIVDGKPSGIDDIAVQHFEPELLEGVGKYAARNELTAHIEVMEQCGDVRWVDENRDMVQSTGSKNYLDLIGSYLK